MIRAHRRLASGVIRGAASTELALEKRRGSSLPLQVGDLRDRPWKGLTSQYGIDLDDSP